MSQNWQADVREFMQAMGQASAEKPTIVDPGTYYLRLDLMKEEAEETHKAMIKWDMPAIADGLVDQLYVIIGTAIAYGIDLQPIWDAVHAANMAKSTGPVREDGKRLKPPGWTPPDVAGLLKQQGWVA